DKGRRDRRVRQHSPAALRRGATQSGRGSRRASSEGDGTTPSWLPSCSKCDSPADPGHRVAV
ncbi:MAG: hypothetical protein AVDCRST_MAG90-3370, partial [uncultured Microvirga sp.]